MLLVNAIKYSIKYQLFKDYPQDATFPMAQSEKTAYSAGETGNIGLIPVWGRSW